MLNYEIMSTRTEELSTVEVTCPVSVKQQFFNGLLGNRPKVKKDKQRSTIQQ
jgi:hypothetical protein